MTDTKMHTDARESALKLYFAVHITAYHFLAPIFGAKKVGVCPPWLAAILLE